MKYSWDIPVNIKGQIRCLPPTLKQQVWGAIDDVLRHPSAGKSLSEELAGYRSYRIGRYRLIYQIQNDRIVLVAIGSRKDIYERLVLEIGRAKIRERVAKYGLKSQKTARLVNA